jgi:hypothetical protein
MAATIADMTGMLVDLMRLLDVDAIHARYYGSEDSGSYAFKLLRFSNKRDDYTEFLQQFSESDPSSHFFGYSPFLTYDDDDNLIDGTEAGDTFGDITTVETSEMSDWFSTEPASMAIKDELVAFVLKWSDVLQTIYASYTERRYTWDRTAQTELTDAEKINYAISDYALKMLEGIGHIGGGYLADNNEGSVAQAVLCKDGYALTMAHGEYVTEPTYEGIPTPDYSDCENIIASEIRRWVSARIKGEDYTFTGTPYADFFLEYTPELIADYEKFVEESGVDAVFTPEGELSDKYPDPPVDDYQLYDKYSETTTQFLDHNKVSGYVPIDYLMNTFISFINAPT